jgi:hypothetical protein
MSHNISIQNFPSMTAIKILFDLQFFKELAFRLCLNNIYPMQGFFQDFGNMTHTHGIGNVSGVLLKIGKNA